MCWLGKSVDEVVVGEGDSLIIFEMIFDESSKNSVEGFILGVMEPNEKTVSSNVTWWEMIIWFVFKSRQR